MFKLIVQTSLRNRLFVLAVAAVLVGYGIVRAAEHSPSTFFPTSTGRPSTS